MMRSILVAILVLLAAGSLQAGLADGPVHTILWNRMDYVVVVDSMAISLSESAISVCSWSDSMQLFVIEQIHDVPFRPVSARQVDSLLLVRSDDDRIAAYDIRSLPSLELVWLSDPGIPFSDYALWDDTLYLSAWFDGLWRYSVSGDGALTFLDSSMVGVFLTQLARDESHLYVLDEYNGLMRYDPNRAGSDGFVDYLYVPEEIASFVLVDQAVTMAARGGGIVLGHFSGESPIVNATVAEDLRPRRLYVHGDKVVAVMARSIEVRARATGSLLSSTDVSGLAPDGDLFVAGDRHLLVLPRTSGGLYLFDIDEPLHSGPGIYRSGPIKALAFLDGHLFTGGGSNPIDVYQFDAALTPELEYTMYPRLTGAQAIVPVGDSLITYYAGINRVAFILEALQPDSFFLERSFYLADTLAGRLHYAPRFVHDSLRAIITTGELDMRPYAISDSGIVTPLGLWRQFGRISAACVHDSLVFIGTLKSQLWLYRIDSTFDIQLIATRDLPGVPSAIEWINDRAVVFVNARMMIYGLDDEGLLQHEGAVNLPVGVTGTAFANDRLYTIGSGGIAVFRLDKPWPELVEYGGPSGSIIAVSGSILAASDGGSVEIYRIDPGAGSPDDPELPKNFTVFQNYPNPFNSETVIRYAVPDAADVRITVYNALGQRVKTLVNSHRSAGEYQTIWDGTDLRGEPVASGIYLYRLEAGAVMESRKMVLVK